MTAVHAADRITGEGFGLLPAGVRITNPHTT